MEASDDREKRSKIPGNDIEEKHKISRRIRTKELKVASRSTQHARTRLLRNDVNRNSELNCGTLKVNKRRILWLWKLISSRLLETDPSDNRSF